MGYEIKIIGVVLIIAATTLFGFQMSHKLVRRTAALQWFSLALSEISHKIRCGSGDLPEILKSILGYEKYLTVGQPFCVNITDCGLTAADRTIASEFFSTLGMGDSASQVQRCNEYAKLFEQRKIAAEKQQSEKGKIYRMFGLFSGISVALILI